MAGTQFKVGTFNVYRATEGISLGFIDPRSGGYTAEKNEEIETDGITVILQDGRRFENVPQIRGAIDSNWFVPVADKQSRYQPKPAEIQVRGTEQRGQDRPERRQIAVQRSEEDEVLSVANRKRIRESANADVRANPKPESREAQEVLSRQGTRFFTGDFEVDDILLVLDQSLSQLRLQHSPHVTQVETTRSAASDTSIFDLIESLEKPDPRLTTGERSRLKMPVHREEDLLENTGKVVGQVVERETRLVMDVAPATPAVRADQVRQPRLGNSGAIIVDDQKYVGRINLSGENKAAPHVGETAAVSASTSDMVRVAEGAQVGTGSRQPKPPRVTEGTVGRITRTAARNQSIDVTKISQNHIDNLEKGSALKVAYEVERDNPPQARRAIATGDVQEATVGDTLEEVLPDAVRGPLPESPHAYSTSELDLKYQAIKNVMPEFEWNREQPVAARVAEALKHIRNRQMINAILAVETPVAQSEIKRAIVKELERLAKPTKKKQSAKTSEKSSASKA
jgi:hypothetical protein